MTIKISAYQLIRFDDVRTLIKSTCSQLFAFSATKAFINHCIPLKGLIAVNIIKALLLIKAFKLSSYYDELEFTIYFFEGFNRPLFI